MVLNDADGDGVCDADEVAGCQDEMAATATRPPQTRRLCVFADDACEVCEGDAVVLNDATATSSRR